MSTEPGQVNKAFESDVHTPDVRLEMTGDENTRPPQRSHLSRGAQVSGQRGNSQSADAESHLSTRPGASVYPAPVPDSLLDRSLDSGIGHQSLDAGVSDLSAASSIRDVSSDKTKGEIAKLFAVSVKIFTCLVIQLFSVSFFLSSVN